MISIIVAIAKNRVIGKNNDIPWRLSDDLKHFANITRGHTVIMGRKTYDSILARLGHGLPNRKNIVLTTQTNYAPGDAVVVHSIEEARGLINPEEEAFVLGGNSVFKDFLPTVDKLYITEVDKNCDGDAFFPEWDKADWQETFREAHQPDDKNECPFVFRELVRQTK